MAESHVVSGLVAKRAEVAGRVAHHQKEIERIGGDLDHIDAAIKIFAPNIDLRTLRPKEHRQRNSHFTPGQAPRVPLDILLNARKAMARAAPAPGNSLDLRRHRRTQSFSHQAVYLIGASDRYGVRQFQWKYPTRFPIQ